MGFIGALIELLNKLIPDPTVSLRQRILNYLPGAKARQEKRRQELEDAKKQP